MQSLMNSTQEVTVTDIKMPFWSMVTFMLKWAVATIPAVIVLTFAALGAFFILIIVLGMFGMTINSISK